MALNKFAKGTIAFIAIIAVSHIWTAISLVYKPPWAPWPPIVPLMKEFVVPFLHHFYRPVLIGLTGLVIYWVWEDRRAGYLLAFVLAAIASVFGVAITLFNALSQQWSGTFTAALSVAFPALMALWFSMQGYRHSSLDTQTSSSPP